MASAGGFKAIKSVVRYATKIGPVKLVQAVSSKNTCKACAFGTGGQNGGLRNEAGRGLEICNKNIQAQLSDIRQAIPEQVFRDNSIKQLANFSGKQLEDLGRLATPIYKSKADSHYQPISYQQALDKIVAKMSDTKPDRSFFYASGRSSNEAAFLLQLLARLYGTNNVNNCSYYCHQASGVGLTSVIGSGTATIQYKDLQKADLIFVLGANPASNHPRFVKTLVQCRRRGGQVIVINPAKELGLVKFASPSDWRSMIKGGEKVASKYIQPNIGGDIALLLGIAKSLIENNLIDVEFINQYTNDYEQFLQHIESISWDQIHESSGIDTGLIEQVANDYACAENVIFAWGMGMTHHRHGVNNIQAIASVAMLCGQLGKPGAGLLPLRGHSNIQGVGSMGFTPKLKEPIFNNIREKLNIDMPENVGMDTMSSMIAAQQGKVDFAWLLGGNLYASNPDAGFAAEALDNIPFKVFVNSTLNTGHTRGVDGEVLILPIRVRDEETQATTQESMFNFVRLSDGGITRFADLKSEVELVADVGSRLVSATRFDFNLYNDHREIRNLIGQIIPGFNAIRDIDKSKEEFQIAGRTFYEPRFATDDGKARFIPVALPEKSTKEYMLTSVRSEGQFNSIIFHEEDVYRNQRERWVVMMNKDDMLNEGLKQNDKVDLFSDTGCMRKLKVRRFNIKSGNLMVYYPEANILVPRVVDKQSGTPGFKSVSVEIKKSN